MKSGSWRSYSLYAIGEIALVVIGILIALQINNWNEFRKERLKEEKVLEQIAKSIEFNTGNFKRVLERMERNNERTKNVISIIENKRAYDDEMNVLFHSVRVNQRLSVSSVGFEELKNSGFDIIQSDSLKEFIVMLFEVKYSQTEKIFNEVKLYSDDFSKFLIDNFFEIRYDKLQPVNYDEILNSHFYYSSLLHIRSIRNWRIDLIEKSLVENESVLQLIQDELQAR